MGGVGNKKTQQNPPGQAVMDNRDLSMSPKVVSKAQTFQSRVKGVPVGGEISHNQIKSFIKGLSRYPLLGKKILVATERVRVKERVDGRVRVTFA